MRARVLCDVVDVASLLGAVRFERAAATLTIARGVIVEIAYGAAVSTVPPMHRSQAEAAARISGIELNLDEIVEADSTDAWRMLVWAETSDELPEQANEQYQRTLMYQLWRAHFLEGADIADPLVLSGRAAVSGLDLSAADEVLESGQFIDIVDLQRTVAAELGVTELPFIVVDGEFSITGLHSQDNYVQALAQIFAKTRSLSDSAEPDTDNPD